MADQGSLPDSLPDGFKSIGPKLGQGVEEQLFHSFFESDVVGNAIADANTLRFLRVNRAFCEITGYSAEEFKDLVAWDLILPEELERDRVGWAHLLQKGPKSFRTDKRYARKNGTTAWVSVTTAIISDSQDHPLYVQWVVQDVTNHREALQALQEERKFLECALFEVVEREQRRVGLELHDHLCQELLGAAFAAKAIGGDLEKHDSRTACRLLDLARLINAAVVQVRDISRGLHPVELDSEGLMSALQELARRTSLSCACDFHCEDEVLVKNPATALHAYRIAQEVIVSALEQTRANQITISLSKNDDTICLQITDNGKLEADLTADPSGTGAKTLQYRARAMQGAISLVFVPGEGTRMTNTFPINP